jgi:prepilin-type N-terminal cleavage/methylation domain-containing protein
MNAINTKSKAPGRQYKEGMTLIELITVIFIGSLLLSMIFLVYTNSSRSMLRQDVIMEQLLNLRSGLNNITRDIRGAGNGFSLLGENGQAQMIQVYNKNDQGEATSWFRYPAVSGVTPPFGMAPIYAVDGDQAPDSVYLSSLAPDFASPLGILDATFHSSDSSLSLTNVLEKPASVDMKEVVKKNDYVAIVPTTGDPVLVEVKDDVTDLSTINIKNLPGPFPNGISDYPSGSIVYNVKSVTLHNYKVDVNSATNETFLILDALDTEDDIMAEGIEDLQIGYCFADCDPTNLSSYVLDFNGLNTSASLIIKSIHVVMVSRTSRPDPYGKTFSRIPALNHTTLAMADSHPRRFLEATVQLRNF